jgi:hypothetical protein
MSKSFANITNDFKNTVDIILTAELRRVFRRVTQSTLINIIFLSGSLRIHCGSQRLIFEVCILRIYLKPITL